MMVSRREAISILRMLLLTMRQDDPHRPATVRRLAELEGRDDD